MASLLKLQAAVLEALLEEAPERAAPEILGQGIDPVRRLGVYANTIRVNVHASLAASFPVLARLVGEDYFRQAVRDYQRRTPSRSGDLQHVGREFPAYWTELHGAGEYRYLGHVARFEWACQECLLAADHPPLDLAALARVPPEAYDALRFAPHPSLRRFAAPYPVLAIWQANADPAVEPPPVDLGQGGDRLALVRRRMQLEFHPLGEGEWAFLEALERRAPLAAALEAGAHDARFEPAAALPRFVTAGIIAGFQEPMPGDAIV